MIEGNKGARSMPDMMVPVEVTIGDSTGLKHRICILMSIGRDRERICGWLFS